MARTRSKSLVQKIALDGPHINGIEHENGSVSNGSRTSLAKEQKSYTTLRKSRSIPSFQKTYKPIPLDPLTSHETDILWERTILNEYSGNKIEYDMSKVLNHSHLSQLDISNFQKILSVNINQLSNLKQEVVSLDDQLTQIQVKYNKIDTQTREFNIQSQELIKKEQDLNLKVESINLILKNFENLEEITKKLSMPNNLKLIRSQSFKKILENLNSSLEFFNNSDKKLVFKNIEMYKIKFRQCMTRALTLVKDYLINDLKKLESQVNKSSGDLSIFKIAIYKEFEGYLADYKEDFYGFNNLINIFLNRIENKHELEYRGLLMEIVNYYFKLRVGLVQRIQNFDDINIDKDNLVKFTQDNLLSMKKLLNKEFKLFKGFFEFHQTSNSVPELLTTPLYDFFRSIVDPFYDLIRQKILKETNISLLCQLTNLLQNNYYEFEDEFGGHEDQIKYGEIFQPILNDCESRLVFRIQIYVDNKLIPYQPTSEDLKLGHINETKNKKANSLDEDLPENLFEELYLPLGKALTILSNIYELINSMVFDDLAHYIVHSCIEILKAGSALCMKLSGEIDSRLYYLKNLIILKYQLNNFDIQFVRTETSLDFTSGLNELYNLIRTGEVMINVNQNGWFNLIKKTVPKIINNMIDAKLEIEMEINYCINLLLTDYLNLLIDPLNKVVYETATQEEFNGALQTFKGNTKTLTTKFKSQIISYINDYNILKILFNNLIQLLINYYEGFYLNSINMHKSLSLDDMMEPEVFNNYFNNIVDELLDDESLNNNLLDIKPLLKFNDELEDPPVDVLKLDIDEDKPLTSTPEIGQLESLET